MTDPRIEQYASILLDTCLKIEPRQQVAVFATPLGRPLVEETCRQIGRKGAYVLLQMAYRGTVLDLSWIEEAPMELLNEPAPLVADLFSNVDAVIAILAPENTREGTAISQERQAAVQSAYRPAMGRMLDGSLQWVGCQFPCPALAQDAGMNLAEFEEFLYGAVLLDWDAEERRMRRYADAFDSADEVRIVGEGTDLRFSLAGRVGKVDAGGANMPGGEFFFSPVEDSAHGEILFNEFPAVYGGRELQNIRLRFEGGKVVDASADSEQDFLRQTLAVDEGASRVGELGIGCNPGITRYMKNVAFDEKIDGTVHVALGNGFPFIGGQNVSAIHWDIVKDLRNGGRIELDGKVAQENGRWLI